MVLDQLSKKTTGKLLTLLNDQCIPSLSTLKLSSGGDVGGRVFFSIG